MAYFHCHEFQYSDFYSVQGLLEAMKDYQRKAPDQLSNDDLNSILWNKVPIKLQKEVVDWSLQELLHCLLRGVAECEHCNTQSGQKGEYNGKKQTETSTIKKIETQERTQAECSKKRS